MHAVLRWPRCLMCTPYCGSYRDLLDLLFAKGCDADGSDSSDALTTTSLEYCFLASVSDVWSSAPEAVEVLMGLIMNQGIVAQVCLVVAFRWAQRHKFHTGRMSVGLCSE